MRITEDSDFLSVEAKPTEEQIICDLASVRSRLFACSQKGQIQSKALEIN